MKTIFDKDTWQEIFGSIGQNKLRTMITIIGVLWGIFLYIVLSGAAKGVDNGFEQRFERISANSLFIWTQSTSIPYKGFKIDRNWSIKLMDVETVKNEIPEIPPRWRWPPINLVYDDEQKEKKVGMNI